jgi:hypothetical protein
MNGLCHVSEIIFHVGFLFLATHDDSYHAEHRKHAGNDLNYLLCVHSALSTKR